MNKRLFVVRHAKSSWDFPQLADFERPLNKRGLRDIPDMSQRLLKTGYQVDFIRPLPLKEHLVQPMNMLLGWVSQQKKSPRVNPRKLIQRCVNSEPITRKELILAT